jgi:hypothetical protein
MHGAGLAIENRAGVAAGVQAVIPDYFEIAPGSAAIAASTKDQVDVTCVATPAHATLRECKQVAIGGLDHCGNSEGVISRLT